MAAPTLNYSKASNGKRYVSINGGAKLPTDNTAAPAGTHDVKASPAGVNLISIAGDLHEPHDVSAMRGRI